MAPIAPILPQLPTEIKQSKIEHDDNSQSPQYETQEYPPGSGFWWQRNSPEEEWQRK
jgi:hypothetical protein